MKTSLLMVLLFCLIVVFSLPAQEAASATDQQPQFAFSADWNLFRAADSMIYVEYTAAIQRSVLTYKPDENNKYIAEFLVESHISQGDSILNVKNWRSRDSLDSLDAASMSMIIPTINSFTVEPGDYFIELKITDLFGAERARSVKFEIQAESFNHGLALSDVQMATSIQRDNTDNLFTKNGYKVMPNPSSLYGIGLPIMYTYTEVYNLADATTEAGQKFTMTYRVLDNDGNEVKTFPPRERPKPGHSAVAVNNLNVVTLVSGTYTVEVTVTDHETGGQATTSRKFFVYRQDDFAEGGAAFQKVQDEQTGAGSPGTDASRYDAMTEEELDLEFDECKYIAEREETQTWSKLNLEGKREYIKEFWAKRDNTPATPINEFKDEYMGRIQLVNQMFRGAFREGWKSDRGRIMLLYGKPDEIERFPASSDAKEYHLWHYYAIQGGVMFVFVDKRNMNDLELVHSSARGELYDPDWQRWIDPNY